MSYKGGQKNLEKLRFSAALIKNKRKCILALDGLRIFCHNNHPFLSRRPSPGRFFETPDQESESMIDTVFLQFDSVKSI